MRPVARFIALGTAIAYGLAVPAAAQDAERSTKKKANPNEMVCEKHEVLGTRLAAKRVCKTRAEWAEQRRLEREEIQRVQVGSNCTRGNGQAC